MIREASKHQNVHSTTSYFLLSFWFLDSYYFWQWITEKYSFRYLKVRRHSLLTDIFFFTLLKILCQKVPLRELEGEEREAGLHVCWIRGFKNHIYIFLINYLFQLLKKQYFSDRWQTSHIFTVQIIYRNFWPKNLLWCTQVSLYLHSRIHKFTHIIIYFFLFCSMLQIIIYKTSIKLCGKLLF